MQDREIKTVRVERTYILLQPIGDGAYGTLYDAFDSWSGQHAAIKILKTDFASDAAACKRFEEEAVLTAFVDHLSTLPIYGSGHYEDDRPFYVMKKVQGRTLESLLQERGDLASDQRWIARLLAIFTQVCKGVADAHAQGVIHRDLKPENIIVSDQDYATILDWGLAKRHSVTGSCADSNRTITGQVMGSPGYMAPEQARSDRVTAVTEVTHAEGCFGRLLLGEDPAEPLLQFRPGGRPPPFPSQAGLGVTVQEEVLRRYAVEVCALR